MSNSKERKRVTIHTNLIEVQFYWNKKTVVSQACILFILYLMHRIGFTHAIKEFCLLGMVIDIGIIVIMLLPGFYVSSEFVTPGQEQEQNTQAHASQVVSTGVDINHQATNSNDVVRESNATIQNTVGGNVQMPTMQAASTNTQEVVMESQSQEDTLSTLFEGFNSVVQEAAGEQVENTEESDMDQGSLFDLFSGF